MLAFISALLTAAVVVVEGGLCPDTWVQFENSCYVFIDEYVPWTSAKVMCDVLGAQMLEVESQAENDFIVSEMAKLSRFHAVWLGLTDFEREGRWVWNSNREVPEYTHWGPGQPSSSMGHENGEDCAQILHTGEWNDITCEYLYQEGSSITPSPVCEKSPQEEEIIG